MLADKTDEETKTRLCIDYRKLNQITIPDSHPFPRIEDIFDRIYGAKYFTTLDVTWGFWHIPICPKDIQKTTFVTMDGHFEWTVLPFGYRNAPPIFQRVIQHILFKYDLGEFTKNYYDDIIIYSSSFEKHLEHIELVFEALTKERVKLKLSKCQFACKEIKFLGHVLGENMIKPFMIILWSSEMRLYQKMKRNYKDSWEW